MSTFANRVIALVGELHVYILVLETFLWDKPRAIRSFNLTPEFAAASKTPAANQGLNIGFPAAGLLWGLSLGDPGFGVKTFLLLCVLAQGLYGAAAVGPRIVFIKGLPAALGLALLGVEN